MYGGDCEMGRLDDSSSPFIQTRGILHFPFDSFGLKIDYLENIYIPFSV